MAYDDTSPPRKKSRFFTSGKSKIEALLRRKKKPARNKDKGKEKDEDKGRDENLTSESDTDNEVSISTNSKDQHASAARAIVCKPIKPSIDMGTTQFDGHRAGSATSVTTPSDLQSHQDQQPGLHIQDPPSTHPKPTSRTSQQSYTSHVQNSFDLIAGILPYRSISVVHDNHKISAQPADQHNNPATQPVFTNDTTPTQVSDEQGDHLTVKSTVTPGEVAENTSLDLDRDLNGDLLALHLRQFATRGARHPPQIGHSAHNRSTTPANSYSSPKRMAKAIALSTQTLKRKRLGPNLPPPAYIYTRSGNPTFNIFTNGFLLYPELCFTLASHLPLRDLISLYAVSKDFHTIVDSRFTTVCLTQAIRKAPESAQTFHFRAYSEFCRDDPTLRIPHPDPAKAAKRIARKTPSFRWVAFVLHREKVVHELMTIFAERGCPLPARCSLALKRMWILMDLPDNARRVAFIHNHRMFTNIDLYFMMCFFVKLDMLVNDPTMSEKLDGVRKILLCQKGGLDVVLKVLKREMWQKKADFLVAWVKNSMNMERLNQDELADMTCTSVFSVPLAEVGTGKYEFWGARGLVNERTGRKRGFLLRPDQLVMRETLRRGLQFERHFMRCVMYGYVRPDTLESYTPRKYGRRIGNWMNEDYDINDSLGGLRALSVGDGGDPLLDLGNHSRGSRYTIEKEPVSEQERMLRDRQDKLLQQVYEISEAERRQQA